MPRSLVERGIFLFLKPDFGRLALTKGQDVHA